MKNIFKSISVYLFFSFLILFQISAEAFIGDSGTFTDLVQSSSNINQSVSSSTITIGSHSYVEKYLKGNLHDKTSAVREASGLEAVWLCDNAISFVLESKKVLGPDRELDGLAVAAVLSFPYDYVRNAGARTREIIVQEYVTVFESFSSSPNVQITVISKMNSLARELDMGPFVVSLNKMLASSNLTEMDLSVIKSCVNFLSVYGNNESFIYVYSMWNSHRFDAIKAEIENCILCLTSSSMNEAVAVVGSQNIERVCAFFNLINANKSKILENSFCEIAENVLKNSILLVRRNGKTVQAVTDVQVACVGILSENKWTRASPVVLDFFLYAKELYEAKQDEINEDDFISVIESLAVTAPFDSVPALISYLELLNARVEKFETVSEKVTLAVINALGAIGDKTAFDALLGVTYYAYPQEILAAARDALSGLKW